MNQRQEHLNFRVISAHFLASTSAHLSAVNLHRFARPIHILKGELFSHELAYCQPESNPYRRIDIGVFPQAAAAIRFAESVLS